LDSLLEEDLKGADLTPSAATAESEENVDDGENLSSPIFFMRNVYVLAGTLPLTPKVAQQAPNISNWEPMKFIATFYGNGELHLYKETRNPETTINQADRLCTWYTDA
jgi:hypothetical protein